MLLQSVTRTIDHAQTRLYRVAHTGSQLRRYIWNGIRHALRLRHHAKLALFRPFVIECGGLRQALPNSHWYQFGDVDRLVLRSEFVGSAHAAKSVKGTSRDFLGQHPPYVCEVANAHLVGTFAAPLTAQRRIIAENMFGRRHVTLKLRPSELLAASFTKEDVCLDRALSLLHPYCHNYHHWFTDCLIRLEALEEYQNVQGLACDVLVPPFLFPWQSASLDLLGYGADRLRPFTYHHARVNTLLVPSTRRFFEGADDDPITPSCCRWIRDRLLAATSCERLDSTFSRKIFLSRRDAAKGGRIHNEESLGQALATLGFETYAPGEMTLHDQICLFRQAEVIVGVHGAALTNLIFSTRPTVVEIVPETVTRKDYCAIAEIVGARYYRLVATREAGCDTEHVLAPEQLLALLRSLDL